MSGALSRLNIGSAGIRNDVGQSLRISDHGSGLRRIGKCHLNKLWRKNLLYQIMVPDSKDKASLQVELSKSTAGIRALGGIYTFWTMRSILSQIKTTLRSAK